MTEAESIDPEHCVGLYYRRKYGNPDNVCNVTVINKSIKEKYLMERHMTFLESYYTYHTDKFQVNNNDRYILKDCLKSYLGDKITFIRITASFCIDGCTYGRNFLEKYNIEKSHSANVADFYTEKTVPPQVKKTEILEAPVEALVEAPVEAVVKAPVEAVVKSEELLELFEPEQSEQSEKIQLDYIGIDEFFKNSTSGINIEDDTKEMDLEFLNQINFEDDII
jgi:hypothetical protein